MTDIIRFTFCENHLYEENKKLVACTNCRATRDTIDELVSLLKENCFEYLDLTGADIDNFDDDNLGNEICVHKSLKYLCLNKNSLGIDYDHTCNAQFWYNWMKRNKTLQVLEANSFEGMGYNIDPNFFGSCISHLQFIDLSNNYGFHSVEELLTGIIEGTTIKGFKWSNNKIVASDLKCIAKILKKNATIKYLEFDEVYVGNRHCCYEDCGYTVCRVCFDEYEEGFLEIADSLSVNASLKELILRPHSEGKLGRSHKVGLALKSAFGKNSTLKVFQFDFDYKDRAEQRNETPEWEDLEEELNFY